MTAGLARGRRAWRAVGGSGARSALSRTLLVHEELQLKEVIRRCQTDAQESGMSLAIDIETIKAVLLSGTWYEVRDKSFNLDSYEFSEDGRTIHGGGSGGVCSTGFRFHTTGNAVIQGPLTAIEAVSDKKPPKPRG
jgi:hypothetical protein